MPNPHTVAILNQNGGKTPRTHETRHKARVTGLFSPAKASTTKQKETSSLRRSSGRLSLVQKSQPEPAVVSRIDPFDFLTSPHQPKKKKIGLKSKQTNNPSPLKGHGLDLELQRNPRVNLNDSPAKNTRSKNHNPIAQAAKLIGSTSNPPQAPENSRSIGSSDAVQQSRSGKREASGNIGPEVTPSAEVRTTKRAKTTHPVRDERPQTEEQELHGTAQQDEEQELRTGQQHVEELQSGSPLAAATQTESPNKRKLGRPRKSTEAQNTDPNKRKSGRPRKSAEVQPVRGTERDDQQVHPQEREDTRERKAREAQKEAGRLRAEELEELEKKKERFARGIEDAIKIDGCEKLWKSIGAAALTVSGFTPQNAKASTDVGESLRSTIHALRAVYQAMRKDPSRSQELQSYVVEYMEELTDSCRQLVRDNGNSELIKDMYLILIPKSVMLLRDFLQARQPRELFDQETLEELVPLLDIVLDICSRAQHWKPRPTTLDFGVKSAVRNDISANLKTILKRFEPNYNHAIAMRSDREKREDLARRQEEAFEALKRKAEMRLFKQPEELRRVSSPRVSNPTRRHHDRPQLTIQQQRELEKIDDPQNPPQNHTEVDDDILDIEDFSNPPTPISRPHPINSPPQTFPFTRERTLSLQPPTTPTLSTPEKTALLNGLQRHTGSNRFHDIYTDPEFSEHLRERNLDDLMNAARGFSRIMASQLGEVYWNDESFVWLRSTEVGRRDGDGESVVL